MNLRGIKILTQEDSFMGKSLKKLKERKCPRHGEGVSVNILKFIKFHTDKYKTYQKYRQPYFRFNLKYQIS